MSAIVSIAIAVVIVRSGRELLAVSDDSAVNMLAIMLAAQLRGDNVLTPERKDRLPTGVDWLDSNPICHWTVYSDFAGSAAFPSPIVSAFTV